VTKALRRQRGQQLSPRKQQVLALLAEGFIYKEIGDKLKFKSFPGK